MRGQRSRQEWARRSARTLVSLRRAPHREPDRPRRHRRTDRGLPGSSTARVHCVAQGHRSPSPRQPHRAHERDGRTKALRAPPRAGRDSARWCARVRGDGLASAAVHGGRHGAPAASAFTRRAQSSPAGGDGANRVACPEPVTSSRAAQSGALACMTEALAAAGGGRGQQGRGGTRKTNGAQRSAVFQGVPTGRASASVPAATPAPPRRIDPASVAPPPSLAAHCHQCYQ